MAFKLVLLRRAQADVDAIYDWIAKRSRSGAASWYDAFLDAADAIERDPDSCPAAPEAKRLHLDLRQRLFKTRRGRAYRMLFVIANNQVRVLRIRGHGQAPVKRRDIG